MKQCLKLSFAYNWFLLAGNLNIFVSPAFPLNEFNCFINPRKNIHEMKFSVEKVNCWFPIAIGCTPGNEWLIDVDVKVYFCNFIRETISDPRQGRFQRFEHKVAMLPRVFRVHFLANFEKEFEWDEIEWQLGKPFWKDYACKVKRQHALILRSPTWCSVYF